MPFEIYRTTTLGVTLDETVEEFQHFGQITKGLGEKIMAQFDDSINEILSEKVKARVNFTADRLQIYRFCDNVWTLILQDVTFREDREIMHMDLVKIVACTKKLSDDE